MNERERETWDFGDGMGSVGLCGTGGSNVLLSNNLEWVIVYIQMRSCKKST